MKKKKTALIAVTLISVWLFGLFSVLSYEEPAPAVRYSAPAKYADAINGVPVPVTLALIDMATKGCQNIDTTNNLFGIRDVEGNLVKYTYPSNSIFEFTSGIGSKPDKPSSNASAAEWGVFLSKIGVIQSPDDFVKFYLRYESTNDSIPAGGG